MQFSPKFDVPRDGTDRLKGILLVLVIFGHTYAAPLEGDLGKWLLYGVHMPVFLFLSGYLINVDRLREQPLAELLGHYWHRMLRAWLAVSLLFMAINVIVRELRLDGPLAAFQRLFLLPYFHLWYIPVLLIGALVVRACLRTPRPRALLAAVVGAGFLLCETPLIAHLPLVDEFDHRYLGYLVWFAAGVLARSGDYPRLPRPVAAAGIAAGLAVYATGFWAGGWSIPLGLLLLNLSLFPLVPVIMRRLDSATWPGSAVLAHLGRRSLWVYLLHPLITVPYTLFADGYVWSTLVGAALAVLVAYFAAATTVSWTKPSFSITVGDSTNG